MFIPLVRDPRYRSLDVWRGLACLMVVIDHAGFVLNHGDVGGASGVESWFRLGLVRSLELSLGPPLFFVISGYCIAASVDSLRRKGKSPADFLIKRLWRTFPPYWAAVLAFVVSLMALDRLGLERWYQGPFGLALQAPGELSAAQWLGNLSLTETWRPRLGGGDPTIFTRVAWSLCYQEQFYAVCFLVALLAPRRLYGTLAAVTAAVIGFRLLAWDSGGLHRIDGLFPIYWHEFAVGLAVYWRLNVPAPAAMRKGVELGLLALIVIGLTAEVPSTAAASAFGLVMIGLRRWDDQIAALGLLGPVKACGARCYSIYLIHLPVCTVGGAILCELGLTGFWARALVVLPVVAAAAVAAGWGFYALVESRFLNPPCVSWAGWPAPAGVAAT